VIVTPFPGVRVDFDRVPILFPINNSPSVKLDCPVPPFITGRVPVKVPELSDIFAISVRTNCVVAICVVLVDNAAVGAVGVPVNDGDAIVALSNMSAVFAVILAVFALIAVVLIVMLAVLAVIAFVLLVILAVLALMAVVLLVMLAVFALMAVVLLVILAVLEAINVGNVVIVVELTPPTLFTVGKSAVPPKSFVNFNLPFVAASASGVIEPVTFEATKAVVAI
jgi:hypothetical protein